MILQWTSILATWYVILYTLFQKHYFLNGYHLLIFRYMKGKSKLTGAISNSKCLFIFAPQDKLDLQASRPQIYLLFNNLSTERSSSSFLFPFIKVQVLMKNSQVLLLTNCHTLLPSRWKLTHYGRLGQRYLSRTMMDMCFICSSNIISLMNFISYSQPQLSSQK